MTKIKMQKIKKLVPMPKKMRIKTFYDNILETLMINYAKNAVRVKILTVL